MPRRSLARVGVHLGVPSQFSAVEWYGRGPHENYADRKYGAFLRRHAVERLEQLHTPYIFTGADRKCSCCTCIMLRVGSDCPLNALS